MTGQRPARGRGKEGEEEERRVLSYRKRRAGGVISRGDPGLPWREKNWYEATAYAREKARRATEREREQRVKTRRGSA